MREIKFRVRNLSTGKIVGYETLNNGVWFRSPDGQNWEDGTYRGGELQREQFTGHKDTKNKREIYESDIVKIISTYSSYGANEQVSEHITHVKGFPMRFEFMEKRILNTGKPYESAFRVGSGSCAPHLLALRAVRDQLASEDMAEL
jgi:hypothetical protein